MKYICFDIETLSLPSAHVLSQFNPDKVKLGNVTDPKKIEAKIEEARCEFVAGAALDARLARVALIGFNVDGVVSWLDGLDESEILTGFWATCQEYVWEKKYKLVGYFIEGFDLPFLRRRSWLLGVKVPPWIYNDRGYVDGSFIDLHKLWQCGDRMASTNGLDGLCKAFGVPGKTGDGRDFAKLWETDKTAAKAYCAADLAATYELARRML